jgi:hypothetical protein
MKILFFQCQVIETCQEAEGDKRGRKESEKGHPKKKEVDISFEQE